VVITTQKSIDTTDAKSHLCTYFVNRVTTKHYNALDNLVLLDF